SPRQPPHPRPPGPRSRCPPLPPIRASQRPPAATAPGIQTWPVQSRLKGTCRRRTSISWLGRPAGEGVIRLAPDTSAPGAQAAPVAQTPSLGLTSTEVAERGSHGLGNTEPEHTSRSVAEILRANILARFNFILGVLLA